MTIVNQVWVNDDIDVSKFEAQPVFKILILGVAVFLIYILALKTSGPMSKREIVSLVLIAVMFYLLWKYVFIGTALDDVLDKLTFSIFGP